MNWHTVVPEGKWGERFSHRYRPMAVPPPFYLEGSRPDECLPQPKHTWGLRWKLPHLHRWHYPWPRFRRCRCGKRQWFYACYDAWKNSPPAEMVTSAYMWRANCRWNGRPKKRRGRQ